VVCHEVRYYYFGHFCVWVSGPELAGHIRTDTRGFGCVACFTGVSLLCIFSILVGSFCLVLCLFIHTNIFDFNIVSHCSFVWFVPPPPFVIVFVILPDPRGSWRKGGGGTLAAFSLIAIHIRLMSFWLLERVPFLRGAVFIMFRSCKYYKKETVNENIITQVVEGKLTIRLFETTKICLCLFC
jgi:hypothetical protein